MSRTDLEKFERRLSLAAYYMDLFGVEEPTDHRAVRSFFESLNSLNEGYDGERSYVAKNLTSRRGCDIPADRLLSYDANIREHLASLNEKRSRPIVFKYFQMLAALCAEVYLDRMTREPEKFRHDINRFFRRINENRGTYYKFKLFDEGDLNKLAYWMATGSGKTLVMHVNYYQWVHYQERLDQSVDNILLLTPNGGLTRQHIKAMDRSGIPCRYFHNAGDGDEHAVKVLEITKLTEDPTGGGESIAVDALEGNNLVFVDEGHKGASGDSWMNYRRRIATEGFTFEYSATFGQSIARESSLHDEYGQAIALNYSYPYFHEDGYGKDYHILNLERADSYEDNTELTDRYLLANLLTFLEQKLAFEQNPDVAREEYNIKDPLLMFVGNSVTAGKTLGSLSTNEERSLTDVQKLVVFLNRVILNQHNWVHEAVDDILAGNSGLDRKDGTDLFDNVFRYLKQLRDDNGWGGERFYEELLKLVFQTDSSAPLNLVNLESADGELGLRVGSADRYFGVIDIGNERAFQSLADEELPEIETDSDSISDSLFQQINQKSSDVQILLGSRKFIEGWSSWRVSAMGLMNFGRSPGPLVIQLFGRGVRLLGKNRSLKRSRTLEGTSLQEIQLLETLHIFGVRARYMNAFRKHLEREGIDVDEWEEFPIEVPTKTREEFVDRGLPITRRENSGERFVDEEVVKFELYHNLRPRIDLRVTGQDIQSNDDYDLSGQADCSGRWLQQKHLDLVDWDRIAGRVWQHIRAKNYSNLVVDNSDIQAVVTQRKYILECPDSMLEVDSYEDVRRLERLMAMIITSYVDNLYSQKRNAWLDRRRTLEQLDADDPNLLESHSVKTRRTADVEEQLEELERKLVEQPDELFEEDGQLPPRVHFQQHLYTPLLLDSDAADGNQIQLKFSPPGLNPGEVRFVRRLADYLESDSGKRLLSEHELFLLRNQAKSAGVSFGVEVYEQGPVQTVYPDFILWLEGEENHHLVFIEPHGLTHAGNIFDHAKVRLHETIKEDERRLHEETGRTDVRLHSFVVSTTDLDKLPNPIPEERIDEYRDAGVYFPDDPRGNYLHDMFERVTTGDVEGQEVGNPC